jgi:hypothetical protein
MVRHPIDTAKSVAQLPSQAAQVPAAIHDINQSADPTGRYLDVAQDTASQGAGQALTALGTAGLGRIAKPAVRLGARTAEAAANQKLVPIRSILNLNTPADEAEALHLKVPGRDFGIAKPSAPELDATGENKPFAGGADEPAPIAPRPSVAFPRERIAAPEAPTSATSPERPHVNTGKIGDLLNEGLGGKSLRPNVSLRDQVPANAQKFAPVTNLAQELKAAHPAPMSKFAPVTDLAQRLELPKDFNPVKGSSVIRGYKYDPATKEFSAATTGGTYIHGDVSPEQVKAFESASSKGKAWSDLKNNSTYVGKIVNGEKVSAKPPRALGSATPDDLAPEWGKALADVNSKKSARIAKPN